MRRGRLSRALVVGQLALSLVLLVSAGLFMRALGAAATSIRASTRPVSSTASLEPEAWGYDQARTRQFYDRLRARVEALGGVAQSSLTARVPLMMGRSGRRDSRRRMDGPRRSTTPASTPGYFDVLRLPLARGRAIEPTDTETSPPVAVINETWRGGSGRQRPHRAAFRFRDAVTTVVGVVRDAKYASLDEDTPPFAYMPLAQVWHPTQTLLVRTHPDVPATSLMRCGA